MSDVQDLTGVSTEELHAEIKRREDEEQRAIEEDRQKHNEEVLRLLKDHPGIIAAISHDRTSCSNTRINNGWHTVSEASGRTHPRCNKCAVLESLDDGLVPKPFVLAIDLRISNSPRAGRITTQST